MVSNAIKSLSLVKSRMGLHFRLFATDPFGNKLIIKRLLVRVVGWLTWGSYTRKNTIQISGTERLFKLSETNVLFLANHQTYFTDAIALLHVFCAVKNGFKDTMDSRSYLLRPKINTYFIAAEETMNQGIVTRLLSYVGSVSIQRSWRDGDQEVNRKVRPEDFHNIGLALNDGWVINFPQGTTKPFAKCRRGVVAIIKKYHPVVIPIVLTGFNQAFDKKSLRTKGGAQLSIQFKDPLHFDKSDESDFVMEKIMDAIEQSEKFAARGNGN